MQKDLQPQTYQISEAAKLLGIGRNHAYEAAKRGEIPAIKIGRRVLVPRAALDRMLLKAAEPGAVAS
jgi:excisionase family DNA binding protein